MDKIVYLCGAIAGCSDEECKEWREFVKFKIPNCLDPMIRDYRGIELGNEKEIVSKDKEDILNSDILVYNFLKPSVGSSMEVLFAYQQNKKVIIINSLGQKLSPWLIAHSHATYLNLENFIYDYLHKNL